jgi:hypothetical protein
LNIALLVAAAAAISPSSVRANDRWIGAFDEGSTVVLATMVSATAPPPEDHEDPDRVRLTFKVDEVVATPTIVNVKSLKAGETFVMSEYVGRYNPFGIWDVPKPPAANQPADRNGE